jgi:TPR repeat protein
MVNADSTHLARERILERPASPELMAWDNPFPTFNPKKRTNKKNHSSLDKDLGDLSLHQTKSAEPRPHTSQGTRSRGDSRPGTAHGYRQPDHDPLPSATIPQQQPLMSPLRKDPPKGYNRGYDADSHGGHDGQYMGPVRPQLNPPHANSYEHTTNGFRKQAFAGPAQPPQRSMTMPEITSANDIQQTIPSPSATQTYWPEHDRPSHGSGQRAIPRPIPDMDFGQSKPVITQSRSNEGGHRAVQDARFYQGHYTDHQAYQQPDLSEQPSMRNEHLEESQETDMPRFSAIASPPNEKFEDHLQPVQNHTPQPAYTKKTYQPPAQAREQPYQIQGQRNASQGDQTPQSSFAEFQFDLSRHTENALENQNGPSRQGPIPSQSMAQQPFMGSRQVDLYQPQRGYEDSRRPPPDQPPGAQFPPQNVSHMESQPRSAGDAHQYLPQESELRQERNFRGAQQLPPSGQGRFYDRTRPDTRQYGETASEPPNYANRGQPSSLRSNRGINDQQYGVGARPYPPQEDKTQNLYEDDPGQVPPAGNTMHPPPVRMYDRRGASGPGAGLPNRPVGPRSPDSLPMHPTPVRPGLMNNGVRVPSGNQDAREQQQRRTTTPPQSALSTTATRTSPESKNMAPPVTLQELNLLQQQVRTNPNDHATALKLAKKLVEAVSVLANEGGRADAKTTAKNREKYSFDAHKLLKKLVSAGYPEAMFYLADCHGSGRLGLEIDPKEAFTLYQSAAKLNHPQSAYRVAVCCEMGAEEGGGTRRDPLKAMQWYKRAATLGDTPAMYKMGMILLKGLLGQQKNPREALSWLKRAAERADEENPHALHELGLLYESAAPNDAIIRDENYSRQLFTQAAELGYKYSQYRLGSAYEYGMLGCPIDARQSIAWYSRAAAQGEHQSELALSGWYLTGSEGLIKQSDTEAYLWARKSASSGLAKAEYAMGYFTEVGIGAPANLEEAKRWYWRAACEFPRKCANIQRI